MQVSLIKFMSFLNRTIPQISEYPLNSEYPQISEYPLSKCVWNVLTDNSSTE